MNTDQKTIEDHVRDAVYTAVGVGLFVHQFTRPHRERAKKIATELTEGYRDCSLQWRKMSRKV